MNPFAKGNKLYSILHQKCPACHEGNLFINRNPYNLKMLDKMHNNCTVCNEDLRKEVGFYYGAMMISHGLTTVIGVIVHFTVFYFWGWNILAHLVFLLTILIGFFPVIFRTARAIWINLFVKYNHGGTELTKKHGD